MTTRQSRLNLSTPSHTHHLLARQIRYMTMKFQIKAKTRLPNSDLSRRNQQDLIVSVRGRCKKLGLRLVHRTIAERRFPPCQIWKFAPEVDLI